MDTAFDSGARGDKEFDSSGIWEVTACLNL